ncbi:MAG: hypothetical protein V4671_22470, partial [Armatimonadota bacterium]
HHVANVGGSLTDKAVPRGDPGLDTCDQPLGTGSGLAKTTTRKNKPDGPGVRRRKLGLTRPEKPIVKKSGLLRLGQRLQERLLLGW